MYKWGRPKGGEGIYGTTEKIQIDRNVSAYLYKMAKNQSLNNSQTKAYYHPIDRQQESILYPDENNLESEEFRIVL